MSNSGFWDFVKWALLGVFCGLVALVMIVLAFMNITNGSWGLAIFLFIVSIVFAVGAIAAFRQLR